MKQKVGIIILNFNGLTNTLECLASLKKISTKQSEVQIFIVDYSTETTEAEVIDSKYPGVTIIRKSGNLGFAAGNNVGIKAALDWGVDFVMLLNNDTVVSEAFLDRLVDFLDSHPKTGCVSPKIYFQKGYEFNKQRYKSNELGKVIWYAGGLIDWNNIYGSHKGVDEVDHGQFDEISETDFVSGCCVLIRRKVLEQIGLLDENLFLYWEDSDFSIRATKAGWQLHFDPEAVIWHKNAGSSGVGSSLHDYFMQRNRLWFGMKYAPMRAKLALWRQSLLQLAGGNSWTKRGIVDYYFQNMGKGSWHT